VSDNSPFGARLVFNNDNDDSKKNLFFSKMFPEKQEERERERKKHEHKMTCNEVMLLIHVCV
jgi:hypothetical protein